MIFKFLAFLLLFYGFVGSLLSKADEHSDKRKLVIKFAKPVYAHPELKSTTEYLANHSALDSKKP